MSFASKLSFGTKLLPFPYIQLSGPITRESSLFVHNMLKKIPSNTKKLGVVVSSFSGSPSQAHIINTKLNTLTNKRGIELYTFIEDIACNAGLLVAMNGHKVYADECSAIGGVEVSTQKMMFGNLVQRVVYRNSPSLGSEMNSDEAFDPQKKAEVEAINRQFSQQMQNEIKKQRNLSESVDLTQIFTAKEAKEHGLVDGFNRIHNIVRTQFPQYELKRLSENPFQKIKKDLKKLNFW